MLSIYARTLLQATRLHGLSERPMHEDGIKPKLKALPPVGQAVKTRAKTPDRKEVRGVLTPLPAGQTCT